MSVGMDSIFKRLCAGTSFANDRSFAKTPSVKPAVKKEPTHSDKSKLNSNERVIISRKRNGISVAGKSVPPPVETFEDLRSEYTISPQLEANLKECGYTKPTPIQMQTIPAMLQERQIFACAPTGSGKTAAFIVPLLANLGKPDRTGFRAIILSPTRELAKQIYRECNRLAEKTGLKPHIISKIKTGKYGLNFSKKFDILITTPNRFIYLRTADESVLNLNNLKWLIIDESDKLFEHGNRGFRDQLADIFKMCDNPSLKRAMFSATYTTDVAKWCKKNMNNIVSITVGRRNTAVNLVEQELIYVGNEIGKLQAIRELVHKGLTPPVLVFVQSKERAKQLFSELIYDGLSIDIIHSDRTQLQRDNVVKAFREGKIWLLICTELMGRGIDFIGIKLVINYDFPPSAISYIHRVGRAGRSGRPGKAITYFTDDDSHILRSIATVMKDSGCEVPDYMLSLKKKKRSKKPLPVPDRKPVTTEVSYEKYKENRLKAMKEGSKRKKAKQRSKAHQENDSDDYISDSV